MKKVGDEAEKEEGKNSNDNFDTSLEFTIKNYVSPSDETLTFQLLFDDVEDDLLLAPIHENH